MKVEYRFRRTPHSAELETYVEERIGKLERYEMKPAKVEFTFSEEKSSRRVDVHVRGDDIEMHAHGDAQTFFEGVDLALEKMARQLARKKARVQQHKGSKVS